MDLLSIYELDKAGWTIVFNGGKGRLTKGCQSFDIEAHGGIYPIAAATQLVEKEEEDDWVEILPAKGIFTSSTNSESPPEGEILRPEMASTGPIAPGGSPETAPKASETAPTTKKSPMPRLSEGLVRRRIATECHEQAVYSESRKEGCL